MVAFVVAICVVVFSVLVKLLLNFNKWCYEPVLHHGQPPLPPGSLGWPVFGNMPAFLSAFKSTNPDSFMEGYISRYGRLGLYKAFLFFQPTVLAATPEACRFVLTKESFETGWPSSTIKLTGTKSFAGLTGEEHLKLRKLTEPALQSPKALQDYIHVIVKRTKTYLHKWSSQDNIVLLTEMRKLTFLTIVHVLYGEDCKLDIGTFSSLYSHMNQGIRAFPIDFPGTAYNKALKARRKLSELIQQVINDRRESTNINRMDALSLLMQQTDSNGKALEDDQLIDLLNMFMNAGHESTSHTIMWVMIFLNMHPHVYEKIKAEQEEVAKRKDGEDLNLGDIKAMPYLINVLNETLRLVNIAPMVFRKALVDVEFKGFTIPKEWHAEAWLRQVHMDPCVHPEPHKFDPERWNRKDISPFTFIPFGLGNRTCPGSELAKLEVYIIIHYLVTGYEWKPLNPGSQLAFLPHPRPKDLYPIQLRKKKNA